jgi:hypothetical protein
MTNGRAQEEMTGGMRRNAEVVTSYFGILVYFGNVNFWRGKNMSV